MRNRLEYIYMEYDRWSTADNFVYCIIWVAMTTVLRYMLDTSLVFLGMKNPPKPDTFIPCGENSANVNKSNKCIFYIYIEIILPIPREEVTWKSKNPYLCNLWFDFQRFALLLILRIKSRNPSIIHNHRHKIN